MLRSQTTSIYDNLDKTPDKYLVFERNGFHKPRIQPDGTLSLFRRSRHAY